MTCNDHEWIVFAKWLHGERRLSLFPAGTIVKNSHHTQISDTQRARFEPMQNLSSGFVELSYVGVLTTTPGRQCAGVPNTTHGARTKCAQQNEKTGSF